MVTEQLHPQDWYQPWCLDENNPSPVTGAQRSHAYKRAINALRHPATAERVLQKALRLIQEWGLDRELRVSDRAWDSAVTFALRYESQRLIAQHRARSSRRARVPEVSANEDFIADYKVLGVLGRGGMGVVYRVERGGREYALKQPTTALDCQQLLRFEREALALARLEAHPHLIKLHDYGSCEGRPYMVLDLIKGRDLSCILKRRGPLPWRRALVIMAALARVLHEVHEQGLVHRDIKPSNILLSDEGWPCLTDFGLVHEQNKNHTLTGEDHWVGSPRYMAPECFTANQETTPQIDIWSLGVTLYELCTGRTPFLGREPMELMWRITHEEPAPLAKHDAKLPESLEWVMKRSLAKDPTQRFSSALSFALACEHVLDEESSSHSLLPALPSRREQQWTAKGLYMLTALSVLTSLILAATFVFSCKTMI